MLAGARVLERSDPRPEVRAMPLHGASIRSSRWDSMPSSSWTRIVGSSPMPCGHSTGPWLSGDRVLQCSYVVANPDEAAMSYASAVGNALENDLFYEPKSKLGLAVLLRGTGMVFHREILERFPWKAYSVAEDVQYALQLIRNGVRITFLPNVRVFSPFPVTREQLAIQRRRWASGVAGLGRVEAMRSMLDGVRRRDARLFDAGWTLLVLSRPVLLLLLLLTMTLASLTWWTSPGPGILTILTISTIETFLLLGYFALGIFHLGLSSRRLRFLAEAPLVVARMVRASLAGIFGVEETTWRRTPRADEQASIEHLAIPCLPGSTGSSPVDGFDR